MLYIIIIIIIIMYIIIIIYHRPANRSREDYSLNCPCIRYKGYTDVVLSTDPMQDHPIETECCTSNISRITSISIYTETR